MVAKTNFTSKNNPIKPIQIDGHNGDHITISEIDYDKDVTPQFLSELTKFFCTNFMDNTKYEPLIKIREGSPEEKQKYLKAFEDDYAASFENEKDEGNLTMLTARNDDGELVGAMLSRPYRVLPGSDDTALYLDSLAIDPNQRGLHLAQIMINKTLDANKNDFTDACFGSTPGAVTFYDKLGFKQFDESDPDQKIVSDELHKVLDYADCLTYYTIPLQPDKPRWYTVCAERIRQEAAKLPRQ